MKRQMLWTLMCAVSVVSLAVGPTLAGAAGQAQVRTMSITGQIAKASHGYIIRGKAPAEVFTILNPEAGILDPLVQSGTNVKVEVEIVSGDNVNIRQIDGRAYAPEEKPVKRDLSVRVMALQGEIGKVPNGYVVRGTDKAVIFTVLNPEPAVLDGLVEAGKAVEVQVRIVSGDNVNIQAIGGKPYPGGKKK